MLPGSARAEPQRTAKTTVGPPEIDPSEIVKLRVLGQGSFGVVYAGKCRENEVAVKVLTRQQFDAKSLAAFRHEVEVMSKIFHPNVNLFMGACTVPGQMMIVTELMRGDLESLILTSGKKFSLFQRLKFAKDAALGMSWLHSSNPQTIHRDLKPSNLLVDDNLTCKICDFGLSQIIPKGKSLLDGQEGAQGTPMWMAPEVMMGVRFNEKADVYSFGLILWFLYTETEPYAEFVDLKSFTQAVCIVHQRPAIPEIMEKTLPELKNLIEMCWHKNPSMRPNFGAIVSALDGILVDCAIEEPNGRLLWKSNFCSKETVPWPEFMDAVAKFLNLLPAGYQEFPLSQLMLEYGEILKNICPSLNLDMECLKAILAEEAHSQVATNTLVQNPSTDSEYFVSIEKFDSVLKYLGPLHSIPPSYDGLNILERTKQMMKQPWFHGDISTRESENRLINKAEGTYLVRFSSTPGCYTISKVGTHQDLKHHRIQHNASGFEIHGTKYMTLLDLIDGESLTLGLQAPCIGSRFLSLFIEPKVGEYEEPT